MILEQQISILKRFLKDQVYTDDWSNDAKNSA